MCQIKSLAQMFAFFLNIIIETYIYSFNHHGLMKVGEGNSFPGLGLCCRYSYFNIYWQGNILFNKYECF